jgi:hypothetical protein
MQQLPFLNKNNLLRKLYIFIFKWKFDFTLEFKIIFQRHNLLPFSN